MALGRQLSPVNTLVTFCLWARRAGLRVGEMHGFTSVNPRAHAKGSWHYDRDPSGFGKGVDINHPAGGAVEREALANAARVAQSLGLAVIYGQHGNQGPTKTHQGHLHVDVGAYSNLGRGQVPTKGGGDAVTRGVQAAVGATVDEVWGDNTNWRAETVRLASRHHGNRHPWGVEHTQRVLQVTPDGDWGRKSAQAHDRAVKAMQRALGVKDDGVWGAATEAAYLVAQDVRWRR